MRYTRPATSDPGNDGSATDATVVVGALSASVERSERIGLWTRAYQSSTMTSPPTITLSSAGASTSISGATTTAPNDSAFTYLGASMANVGTLGSFANCYRQDSNTRHHDPGYVSNYLNVEFETDADNIEVILRSESTAKARYRVWVDGQPAAAHATVGTSGSYYRVLVAFGSSASRRLRIEGQEVSFCGIAKHPTRTIWATVRDTGPVCVALVDSYGYNWDGTNDSSFWVWDCYAVRAGRYLGWDVYPSPSGGTGFLASWGSYAVKLADRLTTDCINLNPDIVLVAGSVNDYSLTLASVQTQVNAVFASLASGLPNALVVGLGGVSPLNTYSTNMTTIQGYISTACTNNNAEYVASVGWIAGTGYSGATTGVGNSDYYAAADALHLNSSGYSYVADRLAGALSQIGGGV